MKLIKIFLKFIFYFFVLFVNRALRMDSSVFAMKLQNNFNNFLPLKKGLFLSLCRLIASKIVSSTFFKNKFYSLYLQPQTLHLNSHVLLFNNKDKLHLIKMLCFFLRFNMTKDTEDFFLKIFKFQDSKFNGNDFNLQFTQRILNKTFIDSFENKTVSQTASRVFLSKNDPTNNRAFPIENVFVHNNADSFDFLTRGSSTAINFTALQDLYNYLKLFDDEGKLLDYPASLQTVTAKTRKQHRIPKNFKGGSLAKDKNDLASFNKNLISKEALQHQVNILKELEFLLKNREALESNDLKYDDLEISNEVKKVMFSQYNPAAPYGNDAKLYTSDLYSKNKLVVARRVMLNQIAKPVDDLATFEKNVGFLSFNLSSDEEWENSSDVPLGGWFTGEFFFINPFVVLSFIAYSFFELFCLIYFMSFFFGNPYDTLVFFFKYPLVYFYENISFFPSPNYFFSALMFWFSILFFFNVHLLELVDEERFDPPKLSWLYSFSKEFVYSFLLGWCVLFCTMELFSFVDLLVTRVFFFGVPGYPNLFALVFLFFYDIFYVLGSVGYFSSYLENIIFIDFKFPVFHMGEFVPLTQRYPLVQPYFLGNPYLDRPNFFLWLADSFLNFLFPNNNKSFFIANHTHFVYQRELIQDLRKYNYLRKNLTDLRFIGQLYSRGWNGFNYRLDLQTFIDPITPSEQVIRFDWRLKNTHSNGIRSRLFNSINFGLDSNHNLSFKRLKAFKGLRFSDRYGYFDYLRSYISKRDTEDWYADDVDSDSRDGINALPNGARRFDDRQNDIPSFFFDSPGSKFYSMLDHNMTLQSKFDRDFDYSQLFNSFWSYVPGNNEPKKYFKYKPFLSLGNFYDLKTKNYFLHRAISNNLVSNFNKYFPIQKYHLHDTFLKDPSSLFPTAFVNERDYLLLRKNSPEFYNERKDLFSKNTDLKLYNFKNRQKRSFQSSKNRDFSNIFNKLNRNRNSKEAQTNFNDFHTALREAAPKDTQLEQGKFLKRKKIDIAAIPNFPYKPYRKTKFISKLFQNFKPQYFLKSTASFTTFSRLENLNFHNSIFSNNSNVFNGSGLVYPFGVFFLGFGRLLSGSAPMKFFSFDYYYSKNHNFFYSVLENSLKQNQFRVMLTSQARFSNPLNGGFRHHANFLYPMLSELRLKEKILPFDFYYLTPISKNYRHLRLDPYESVRYSSFIKGSCYFLDARIQNWLHFNNVIWNDYFHFFFNRSFKTEGNGSKFMLASYNPIQGPTSYKLFIDSPTLEVPKVGQFFYNYISWLQYKFKWLLHPTSTYKRFDSFRFTQQHSNKKFYFTSLLKFYQTNLFRWQQGAQIFQWNLIQSRNFLIHLFFHKYRMLSNLRAIENLFQLSFNTSSNSNKMVDAHFLNNINHFNLTFFTAHGLLINHEINKNVVPFNDEVLPSSEIFIPSFTTYDFRFFQYVVDLRRWKALQTPYIRDWKFETYIKYLGPLLYKDDVSSLMGFFAPFEYRNQIIVSRLRSDSLRFSVFFPKKVIDEQFVNPMKRLTFPIQKFSSSLSKYNSKLANSRPTFYAYVMNRPFLLNGSNYSIFSKKGKKFVSGLYSNLSKFDAMPQFNIVSNDFAFNNNVSFYDFSNKKKKFLKDKNFWFSKIYELQEIRDRVNGKFKDPKILSHTEASINILDQLGKPLNLDVPMTVPRLALNNENQINLIDKKYFEKTPNQFLSNKQITNFYFSLLPRLYPDIFLRFGGPKVRSSRWHMGQSWMKFVVATQNASVYPPGPKQIKKVGANPSTVHKILDYKNSFKNSNGKVFQNKFFKTAGIKRKHGFFNFGLSGIGRLPRLSRSFFHMLFFRNKLDDFKKLKTQFLKIYLMSIPRFSDNITVDFNTNTSFKIFWSFLLGYSESKLSYLNLRYSFLFSMFLPNRLNLNFSDFIFHSAFGTIIAQHSNSSLQNSQILLLSNQYINFKSYDRFKFFSEYFLKIANLNSHSNFSVYVFDNYNFNLKDKIVISFFPFQFSFLFNFIFLLKNEFWKLFELWVFDFFNYFFLKPLTFTSKSDNVSIYIDSFNSKSRVSQQKSPFFFFKKFYNNTNINTTPEHFTISESGMRSKLFFGTFRASLHWYLYPVHYFFATKYLLADTLYDLFYKIADFGLGLNFKYLKFLTLNSSYFFGSQFSSSKIFFRFRAINDINSDTSFVSFNLKKDSVIFSSFSKFYSSLFCLNSLSDFRIKIKNRFSNFEFLKNLFSFQIIDDKYRKYFITYNTFFFSADFLFGISQLTSQISSGVLNSYKLNNLSVGFENFLDDLNYFTVSIDGSGRHNRPKKALYTLDQVFTYREYEKYRHEHHRQRFRGILPHWIQNSFKNRAGFKHYYRSSEKYRRRLNRKLLDMLFEYSLFSRVFSAPAHHNRITYINSLPDISILDKLFTSNSRGYLNSTDKNVNFKDTLNFQNSGVLNNKAINRSLIYNSKVQHAQSLPFYSDSYSFNFTNFPDMFNVRDKRQEFLSEDLEDVRLPDYRSDIKDNFRVLAGAKRKYKQRLHRQRYGEFAFFPYQYSLQKFKLPFKEKEESLALFTHVTMDPFSTGDENYSFKEFRKLNSKRSKQLAFSNIFSEDDNSDYPVSNFLWVPRGSFHRGGGNFVNLKNSFSMNNLFQSPISHGSRREDHFFSTGQVKKNNLSDDFNYESRSPKRSIKEAITEPFYRISPRYLRSLKSRKRLHGIYKNSIGGLSSTARSNHHVYPTLLGKDRKKYAKHLRKYPSNVKRFIRPVSKVIMQVPYLYSKWYTQNPRLSYSIDNNLMKIFINNQFDEVNFICVQSLFLLKRKIMFNIINLKLFSHKNKLLYFYPFVNIAKNESVNQPLSFIILNNLKFWFSIIFNYLTNLNFFSFLYKLRAFFLDLLFSREFFYIRLLNNPSVEKFSHESKVSGDLLFFEDFYYKQTAKRVLSEIAFSGHSVGGWNNPFGLSGQYIPGLSFYAKGPLNFNFSYQNTDFFSGRFFSPELLLDNNLVRQNLNTFDRNFFFNEFNISSIYRKRWHFLAYRISSPISPFIEYERPHSLIFNRGIKHKHSRLPMLSLRRINNIYSNHLVGFFAGLISDHSSLYVHDVTFPFKLKLLNMHFKTDPIYLRKLYFSLLSIDKKKFVSDIFIKSLNSKQFKILTDFYNRMNLSSLVNKRRLGLRRKVWTPFRYNFYYKFNWRSFLHKFSNNDLIGYRRYKLNPFFDLYNGTSSFSLKSRALQHLIISQIPRFELDARRRVPLNFNSKDFVLLFFHYFNYVNDNFKDSGYASLGKKIFKYVNRKIHPYLFTYLYEGNRRHVSNFWNIYDFLISRKVKNNISHFHFKQPVSKLFFKLPKYKMENSILVAQPSWRIKSHLKMGKFGQSSTFFELFKKDLAKFSLKHKMVNYLKRSIFGFTKHVIYTWLGIIYNPMMSKKLPLYYILQKKIVKSNSVFAMHVQKALEASKANEIILARLIIESDICRAYPWVRFFDIRWMRYLFMWNFYTRPVVGNPHAHQPWYSFKQNGRYKVLQQFFPPYVSVSRIHGIYSLYNLRKHRERSLNPQSWLGFDLFSRIRPAFKPFLYKFSKHFMFSKFIPAKGVSSYNSFIHSHTAFDNFFENHPYLSFAVGLKVNNKLTNAESMYKEIRKRSYMLDFARRHHKIANPVNHSGFIKEANGESTRNFYNFNHMFSHFNSGRTKKRLKFKSKSKYLHLTKKMARHFSSYYGPAEDLKNIISGSEIFPTISGKLFSESVDSNFPKKFLRAARTMPLFFRYKGLFTNSNYYSVMAKPKRKIFFLNTILLRPYNSLLKFIRFDNYFFFNCKFLSKFVAEYGTLNLSNSFRFKSYYQPNLKVFFDFNAYKQRYNLGLLFRGLSFEEDFSFFLFRKLKFFSSTIDSFALAKTSDTLLLTSFTTLPISSYFGLTVRKDGLYKGYLTDSKLIDFYFFFEKIVLKLNPVYIFLVFVDSYLLLIYSIFSLFKYFYFFDFSFFVNFFQLDALFIHYIPRRPIFQAFFHFAIFKEYLKFSWLFSLKFLIFNIEYYPYYFMIFSILIILRILSFNVSKSNFVYSPLVVPHFWKFSDLQLNSNSGWFDSAWSEVKHEALDRLYTLHTMNKIELSHEHLLTYDDVLKIKRKFGIDKKDNTFFEPEDSETKTDLNAFERASRTDRMFQKPIAIVELKHTLSRFWSPNFFLPSIEPTTSDKMKLLDIDHTNNFSKAFEMDMVQPTKVDLSIDKFLNIKQTDLRFSFFLFRKQLGLLLSGKLTFFKFLNNLNFGFRKFSDKKKAIIDNYDIDDFSEEFFKLFLPSSSEFSSFTSQNLKNRRMSPDDENIHFYRKPGSIYQSELLLRKTGTENDQLYYVVEFPGKFNNTYINAFSKAYALKHLNSNLSYFGFFTFSRNAKLPTTFEEFVAFCSNNQSFKDTVKPVDIKLEPNLEKMKELWGLFQYVMRYDYNMFNEFNMEDQHLFDVISHIEQSDQYTLFDNLKFWSNKALVDSIDLNFLNRHFFSNNPEIDTKEILSYGQVKNDDDDFVDKYFGGESSALGSITPTYSFLYVFYTYLFLFLFFIFLSFLFCFLFLFLFFVYNYVVFLL